MTLLSKKRAPSRKRVDMAAKAIRFLVPINGELPDFRGNALSSWTPKGLKEVKWPKDFGAGERKLIRHIARVVLTTGQRTDG